jgi:hypothetical protein
MSLFGFNKRPQHRSFDYVPRFYDKDKEELEKRLQKYKDEGVDPTELAKHRIKSGLRSKYRVDESYRSLQKKRSNKTLLYVIAVLTLLTFLIFKTSNLIEVIEKF